MLRGARFLLTAASRPRCRALHSYVTESASVRPGLLPPSSSLLRVARASVGGSGSGRQLHPGIASSARSSDRGGDHFEFPDGDDGDDDNDVKRATEARARVRAGRRRAVVADYEDDDQFFARLEARSEQAGGFAAPARERRPRRPRHEPDDDRFDELAGRGGRREPSSRAAAAFGRRALGKEDPSRGGSWVEDEEGGRAQDEASGQRGAYAERIKDRAPRGEAAPQHGWPDDAHADGDVDDDSYLKVATPARFDKGGGARTRDGGDHGYKAKDDFGVDYGNIGRYSDRGDSGYKRKGGGGGDGRGGGGGYGGYGYRGRNSNDGGDGGDYGYKPKERGDFGYKRKDGRGGGGGGGYGGGGGGYGGGYGGGGYGGGGGGYGGYRARNGGGGDFGYKTKDDFGVDYGQRGKHGGDRGHRGPVGKAWGLSGAGGPSENAGGQRPFRQRSDPVPRQRRSDDGEVDVLFGIAPVHMALLHGQRKCVRLLLNKKRSRERPELQELLRVAAERGIETELVSRYLLDELSEGRPNQGVCLEASHREFSDYDAIFLNSAAAATAGASPDAAAAGSVAPGSEGSPAGEGGSEGSAADELETAGDRSRQPETVEVAVGRPAAGPPSGSLAGESAAGDEDGHPLWVVINEVKDPMNLGAVVRSTYFMGVDTLLLTKRNSCSLTPIVSKASAGTVEVMDVYTTERLPQVLQEKAEQGWQIVGTVGHDKKIEAAVPIVPCNEYRMKAPTILLIGNEGYGIPAELLALCDVLLTIEPRRTLHRGIESLNLSVATGILLYNLLGKGAEKKQG